MTRRRFKTVSPWLLVIVALPWLLLIGAGVAWWVWGR